MVQTATAPARTRAALRALLAAFASLAVILIPLGSAHAAGRLVIESGHVDAFNVTAKGDALKLDLKEDVTGSHKTHAAEDVELHVKSAALTNVPKGWPGEGKGYHLPLTQNHDLLWPGWDTLGVKGTGFDESIKLKFDKVEGPGAIHLFGQGSLSGI
ncbi:MAG: choice-of-anchor M domain-containing protein, partial [Dermabacter sp.]|nr:choice-of-anchor M domain-containing protein [Dermabacter sp.]